jgi:hypothetical protein
MKRRDFIVGATSSAGILLLDGAEAATPCPPVLDGASPSSACPAGDLESDWLARTSGQGVVWFHDFRNKAEVDQFRWTGGYRGGNDPLDKGRPNRCRWIIDDGVTGGACLELIRPAGRLDGPGWWRQFNPLTGASNGRGIDDPGANGSIPVQNHSPSDGSSTTSQWHEQPRPGFYGHESYHSGTQFDGTEFYYQMRVKMDPRRTTSGNSQVGKLFYITFTPYSNCNQEIVTYSGAFGTPGVGKPNAHRMYDGKAYGPLEDSDSLGRPGHQVGSDLADYGANIYCDIGTQPGVCWNYSFGWDTLLYHITPGRNGSNETRVVVYAAHEGETKYTKIWDLIVDIVFDGGLNFGWNAIILSDYNNGLDNSEFYHRYDQLIFSKNFIPCPQV